MSESEFLSRWSRLKRAAANPAPDDRERSEPADVPRDTTPQPDGTERAVPTEEVDLSDLPSLESITGVTDITGFLQRKVPEDLRRSALRKAWSSDPAIRDFIGLSENAWDFNDPNGIPGFGPIGFSPDQVLEMAKKLVGGLEEAAERIDTIGETPPAEPAAAELARADHEREESPSDQPPARAAMQQVSANQTHAPQAVKAEPDTSGDPLRPRRHGGALPR
jgi:hypothetical protein